MLKDVTLGRYYKTDSVLHRLDPRTKMAALVVYIVSVFLAKGPWMVGFTVAVLVVLIALSRVPVGYMFKGLRAIVSILVVTNLVLVLISPNGWVQALLNTIRMVELVVSSNILTLTTRPNDLADGFEKANRWMKHIGVPVHDVATALSIALRFIPILSDEAKRIIDAQKSRCADFETGSIVRRAKNLIPILVPLFNSAFKKADDLALAMDCRLYGSANPTRLHPLEYKGADVAGYLLVVLYIGAFAAVRFIWN